MVGLQKSILISHSLLVARDGQEEKRKKINIAGIVQAGFGDTICYEGQIGV